MTKDWDRVREEASRLYQQGTTLETIEGIFRERGFTASTRTWRLKIKEWKINRRLGRRPARCSETRPSKHKTSQQISERPSGCVTGPQQSQPHNFSTADHDAPMPNGLIRREASGYDESMLVQALMDVGFKKSPAWDRDRWKLLHSVSDEQCMLVLNVVTQMHRKMLDLISRHDTDSHNQFEKKLNAHNTMLEHLIQARPTLELLEIPSDDLYAVSVVLGGCSTREYFLSPTETALASPLFLQFCYVLLRSFGGPVVEFICRQIHYCRSDNTRLCGHYILFDYLSTLSEENAAILDSCSFFSALLIGMDHSGTMAVLSEKCLRLYLELVVNPLHHVCGGQLFLCASRLPRYLDFLRLFVESVDIKKYRCHLLERIVALFSDVGLTSSDAVDWIEILRTRGLVTKEADMVFVLDNFPDTSPEEKCRLVRMLKSISSYDASDLAVADSSVANALAHCATPLRWQLSEILLSELYTAAIYDALYPLFATLGVSPDFLEHTVHLERSLIQHDFRHLFVDAPGGSVDLNSARTKEISRCVGHVLTKRFLEASHEWYKQKSDLAVQGALHFRTHLNLGPLG